MKRPQFVSRALGAAGLLAGVFGSSLPALSQQDAFQAHWEKCESGRGGASMAACTWLIRSGRLSPSQRSLVYMYRGFMHAQAKAYRQAVTDYTQGLNGPGNRVTLVTLYYRRGVAYAGLGKDRQAIEDFDTAIELSPNDADAYRQRGDAYLRLKQRTEAIADYRAAYRLQPKNADLAAKLRDLGVKP